MPTAPESSPSAGTLRESVDKRRHKHSFKQASRSANSIHPFIYLPCHLGPLMCKVTSWNSGEGNTSELDKYNPKKKIISIWSSQKSWVTVGCKLLLSGLQVLPEVVLLIWVVWVMVIVVVDVGIILGIIIIVIVGVLVANEGWGNPNSCACT